MDKYVRVGSKEWLEYAVKQAEIAAKGAELVNLFAKDNIELREENARLRDVISKFKKLSADA